MHGQVCGELCGKRRRVGDVMMRAAEHPPVVEDAMYLQPLGTNSIPV